MNPMNQAIAAAAVRWLMVLAGANGVELGNDQAESIVNGLLMAVPLVWGIYQKWRTEQKIKDAKAGLL